MRLVVMRRITRAEDRLDMQIGGEKSTIGSARLAGMTGVNRRG
jgi:hypothetical protein